MWSLQLLSWHECTLDSDPRGSFRWLHDRTATGSGVSIFSLFLLVPSRNVRRLWLAYGSCSLLLSRVWYLCSPQFELFLRDKLVLKKLFPRHEPLCYGHLWSLLSPLVVITISVSTAVIVTGLCFCICFYCDFSLR